MNKVILIGNVGVKPEIKTLDGGTQVAHFSLATAETYDKKDGTKKQETTWHKIEVWNGMVKVAESNINKGDRLCIEGKIIVQKWTAEDGTERSIVKIRAERIELLGYRREQVENEAEKEESNEEAQTPQEKQKSKGKKGKVVFEASTGDDGLPF